MRKQRARGRDHALGAAGKLEGPHVGCDRSRRTAIFGAIP